MPASDVGSHLLDGSLAGSRALVITGPAGSGKTFAWSATVEEAERRGWRVMRARPSEAEARLVSCALLDLCDAIADDLIEQLPPAQRLALSLGLLRSTADVEAEPRVVARAFSSVLYLVAAAGPVLIAVDDLQWIDAETEAILGYAGRRLPPAGVALVITARTDGSGPEPGLISEISRTVPVRRHAVSPMTAEAIEQVIAAGAGLALTAEQRRRVVELSGGNPFYAIELAHAYGDRGDAGALSRTLTSLVGDRLTGLPRSTTHALSAAAAMRQPRLDHLVALGLGSALAPAERAGLVSVDGAEIVFRHPLYAAAAYGLLTGTERLALHRRLAPVVDGPEERARHLALGTDRPDPRVAAALDIACDRACARAAPNAAVEAARLAIRATPPGDGRVYPRRVRLGQLLFRGGNADAAAEQLRLTADSDAPSDVRAAALNELAVVDAERVSRVAGCAAATQALTLVTDAALAVDLRLTLADISGNKDTALRHAKDALAAVDSSDRARIARGRALQGEAAFVTGAGLDTGAFQDIVESERGSASGRVLWFMAVYAGVLARADQLEDCAQVFASILDLSGDYIDEAARCNALGWMVLVDIGRGDLPGAARRSQELIERASVAGLVDHLAVGYAHAIRVLATLGDDAGVVGTEQALRALSAHTADADARLASVSGYVAFLRGDMRTAVTELTRLLDWTAAMGWREPGCVPEAGYLVEALLAVGEREQALATLDVWENRAQAVGRGSALAWTARCRALAHAGAGELDAALTSCQAALNRYTVIERPLDRALTLLTRGQIHRRFRQKALARQVLNEALGEFERLQARPYAERTRRELARIGGRAAAPNDLTETERRVAELAATGMTRTEIGAALFLSPHTIAANLTRVYRKVGATNRAELAARLQTRAIGS